MLKPVRKSKILREITILKNLKGVPGILQLEDVTLDPMTETISLIFNFFSNICLKDVIHKFDDLQIRKIFYQVFKIIDYTHSRGIFHRDVKPGNIIINPETQEIVLIDWGLSEYFLENQEYNPRVSSRPYKSPEILALYKIYDFSLDIWSIGCMFAAMILKMDHFIIGKSNDDQLVKIVKFFGSEGFLKYIAKYKIELDSKLVSKLKELSK
jgi:casein kinase II subunit alpha